MIDHLHIKNFMCFKELEIPTLKRVNLIAGKNNSGKTTLLDAIRILRSIKIFHPKGNHLVPAVINHILFTRKIFKKGSIYNYFKLSHYLGKNKGISINDNSIDEDDYDANIFIDPPIEKLIYVRFNADFDTLSSLWEEVALTDYEEDVYKILRETIQPDLVRINVGREVVNVRLKNMKNPVPLTTMGDGVNRILLIALSLINANHSILLIDELELGLHYSALEKLWNMIFKYAQKWNIQVFATTHSQDVLRTFHYVSDDEKYIDDAQYIRLQINRKGENEAIIFDGERLRETLDLQLEIR